MGNVTANIEFRLVSINTLQFASIGEPPGPSTEDEIHERAEFAFGIAEDDMLIGCLFHYSLFEGEHPFLTIEVSCDFKIKEEDWKRLHDTEGSVMVIPKGFAKHLAGITVGATRGILHSKTENTPFNRYPVGLINVGEIFTEDAVIELHSAE